MHRYIIGANIAIDGEDAQTLRVRIEDALTEVLRNLDKTATVELSEALEIGPANSQRATARQKRLFVGV